jgi:PHP family Zn ribbon phosphoesterase
VFRFDLHLHSCLSPCGDLDASPSAMARAARAAGLNGVMLADHNSSRNSPAMAEACRREGLACLFGLELTTAEEVHCLTVFDTPEQAAALTGDVYAALPPRVNDPAVFGIQAVVNAAEEVEELEWRLLSAPTRLTIREAGARVRELGGLFIAAHLDRAVFSVTSQLGGLAGDEGFDAAELSRYADPEVWRDKLLGLPFIRSSDAHHPDRVGDLWTEADLAAFTTRELKRVFEAHALRWGARAGPAPVPQT